MVREQENNDTPVPFEESFQPVVGMYFLTAVSAAVINLTMRKLSLPALAEITIGLLPMVFLVLLGVKYLRFLSKADELRQLIHTRAAALTALCLLGYMILLNAALPDGRIGPEDMTPIWMILWLCYLVSLKAVEKKFE